MLAKKRYVVALDLRGHGRSSHLPPGAWYHYVDYFDDLRAVLDHFGWPRADFLGHSLGGTLASLFAATHPERVESLLLVEALGPLTVEPVDTLAQLRRGIDERAAFAKRRPLRVFPDVASAIRVRMAASALSEDAARALVERGVQAVDGGYVWSSDPRLTLASPQRYTEAQVLAMLAGIRAPTLLMLAEPATSYLPDAMMASRAAEVVDIDIVHLAGSHHLHLEKPQAVFEIIERFLRRRRIGSLQGPSLVIAHHFVIPATARETEAMDESDAAYRRHRLRRRRIYAAHSKPRQPPARPNPSCRCH